MRITFLSTSLSSKSESLLKENRINLKSLSSFLSQILISSDLQWSVPSHWNPEVIITNIIASPMDGLNISPWGIHRIKVKRNTPLYKPSTYRIFCKVMWIVFVLFTVPFRNASVFGGSFHCNARRRPLGLFVELFICLTQNSKGWYLFHIK